MGIEVGLGQAPLNDTATVDFTSSKLSAAPKAVMGLVGDGGANGTENADWRMGYGFTDGSTDAGVQSQADDGGASEDVQRGQGTWVCQRITSGSRDRLTHNSFLTNGWRANHTDRGNFGKLALAAMFGGSDVVVETGTAAVGDGTQQTITLNDSTLTPTVILFAGASQDNDISGGQFFVPSFGVAHNASGGIVQRSWIGRIPDGASDGDPRAILSTSAIGGTKGTYTVSLDSISQGQFKWTASSDGTPDKIQYLAIQLENANVALVDVDTPTSTGLNEQTGPGFQPKFVLQYLTMLTALDTSANDASAGALAFSLFNDTEAFCYSFADEDGAATINTQSLTHDRPVYYDADDGTLAFNATFSQFTSSGWELDYATVDGTTRKGFALAIGESGGGGGSGGPTPGTLALSGVGV